MSQEVTDFKQRLRHIWAQHKQAFGLTNYSTWLEDMMFREFNRQILDNITDLYEIPNPDELRESLEQANSGNTYPIETLFDDISETSFQPYNPEN